MPLLTASHLRKTYDRGRVTALRDLSLSIESGEIFGLVGPDGAGKTTLFRLLATLLLPDSGGAQLDGLDLVADYRAIRRHIGYMPGRFSLYTDLSIDENLAFFASTFGLTWEQSQPLVEEMYRQLRPFRHRRAGQLSGGVKQKLALCCALIHAPRLLLLDEPTTGVDPVSRRELWAMLRRLSRERGITIVVATPYREEVMQCDRIALMSEGDIVATGRPEEVLPPEQGITTTRPPLTDRLAIETRGLTKAFGDFLAVDHIDFGVREGEIFGFLGANGAGKTTAMRMLCGLSLPTEGSATVGGFDCATQPELIKRHIGYMSQRFALYDDLTVAENLRLFGGIYGMAKSDIAQRSEEMLTRLGMTQERDCRVEGLPLGWKQRLAFAVSILHRPRIVFLDEPTGGVDVEARRQFWELIVQTAAEGTTIFVTTHYMDEADYCDRVSIMVDGRIAALDTPEALRRQFAATSMYEVFLQLAQHAKARTS